MAKATFKMPDEFLMKVSRLADRTDEILPKVLEAGAEAVKGTACSNLLANNCTGKKEPSHCTGTHFYNLVISPALQDKTGVCN